MAANNNNNDSFTRRCVSSATPPFPAFCGMGFCLDSRHPQEHQADAVVHFGMHGTVEWLPGAPLGNTGLSWSDVLLGELPNV